MKNWNKNGATADVENLLRPLAKIVRKVYKQKPNVDIGFDYKGYRVYGDSIQPDKRFSKKYLEDALEDQNVDLIDNVLITAFQLGIEQGKRIDKDTVTSIILTLRASLKTHKNDALLKGTLICANNLLPESCKK